MDFFCSSLNGNPDLCVSGSCKKKQPVAAIVAPIAAVVFVLLIVFIVARKLKRTEKGNV